MSEPGHLMVPAPAQLPLSMCQCTLINVSNKTQCRFVYYVSCHSFSLTLLEKRFLFHTEMWVKGSQGDHGIPTTKFKDISRISLWFSRMSKLHLKGYTGEGDAKNFDAFPVFFKMCMTNYSSNAYQMRHWCWINIFLEQCRFGPCSCRI